MKKILAILVVLLLVPLTSSAQDFCEGNFDYDPDQDGSDAFVFKTDFGRSTFGNPCPTDGPAPVPKTGQVNSIYPGDDGDLECGMAWPNPRFTDNGDGTITDNLNGLIWMKDANCFGGNRTWAGAIMDCQNLVAPACGINDDSILGDWRLPNLRELLSLMDYEYYEPALSNSMGTGQWTHDDPFINLLTTASYWTSTSLRSVPWEAWTISTYLGSTAGREKGWNAYVWCVRGGH